MFVFIPSSIPPVRFGPGGTVPAKISIPAVTDIYLIDWFMICRHNLRILSCRKSQNKDLIQNKVSLKKKSQA